MPLPLSLPTSTTPSIRNCLGAAWTFHCSVQHFYHRREGYHEAEHDLLKHFGAIEIGQEWPRQFVAATFQLICTLSITGAELALLLRDRGADWARCLVDWSILLTSRRVQGAKDSLAADCSRWAETCLANWRD